MTDRSQTTVPGAALYPNGFSIDVKPERETVEILPAGELDIATVGQLQRELQSLIEARFARIVIDLRAVEFLDSTGVHALIAAYTSAQRDHWQLEIIPARPPVQRILQITGTHDRLPFTGVNGA